MKRPLGFQMELNLPLPSPDDKRADVERLAEAAGIGDLHVPLWLMGKLPSLLRRKKFQLRPVFAVTERGTRLIEADTSRVFGIALDIGTTNIVASLFNLTSMEKISSGNMTNPQTVHGPDILSRIHLAMSKGVEALRETLVLGLNSMISRIMEKAGAEVSEVYALAVASNTAISHFLLGLDVTNLPVEPYIPVVHSPGFLRAGEIGLDIHPEANVYIYPNAGSYVGGDIISGILSTGIHKAGKPAVLIDVGTNAEIVVGMKDWLLVGAGAAGPALEGGVFSAGMRAQPGAIYRIDIDPLTHEVSYKTIGDARPAGICGSASIDLVAGLYERGIIDRLGRFRETKGVSLTDDGPAFTIANTDKGEIRVSEREVSNFLRSKAAMFTSLHVLLKSIGLGFREIDKVFIAGALGSGVRAEKAIAIGMLPDIPVEKYIPANNTSLGGAELLLADAGLHEEIEGIRSMITYREMNTDSDFMREFPEALFLPHANPAILSQG